MFLSCGLENVLNRNFILNFENVLRRLFENGSGKNG